MARTGRFVVLGAHDGLELVDALGTAPRHRVKAPAGDFACVGGAVWMLDGAAVRRLTLEARRELEPVALPWAPQRLAPVADDPTAAWVFGAGRAALVVASGASSASARCEEHDVGDAWPLAARRLARAGSGGLELMDVGRGVVGRIGLDGAPRGAWPLFAGRAIATLVTTRDGGGELVVCRADGAIVHRLAVPAGARVAVADQRGTAIAARDGRIVVADLRYGRLVHELDAPFPIAELAIDADGQYVAMAAAPEAERPGAVLHVPLAELVTGAARRAASAAPAPSAAPTEATEATDATDVGQLLRAVAAAPVDAAVEVAAAAASAPSAPPDDEATPRARTSDAPLPDAPPVALGAPAVVIAAAPAPGFEPYPAPHAHLDELLDLVAAMTARAIAVGWHTGRLSAPTAEGQPFEREVVALLGGVAGLASDQLRDADARVAELDRRASGRARATLAAGGALPLISLAHELQLSGVETQILAVAVGPVVRAELARLCGILSNDEHRAVCDVALVEEIVAGADRDTRARVAQALADDAPLVRHGLVRIGAAASRPFAAVTVDEVLVERLRGVPPSAGLGDVARLRHADRALDELRIAPAAVRAAALACAEPRAADEPLRLVLRGRRGAGRTSLAAALAARVGRGLTVIDASRIARGGRSLAARLAVELDRAMLRRTVPVVTGLDGALDGGDVEGQDLVRQALRAHPGPVIVRASPEASLPLDPGYVTVALPPLAEGERAEAWADALARAAVPCRDPEALAARYRVGPGTITTVVAQVAARRRGEGAAAPADAGEALDEAARQHVTTRLDRVASRVTRLATWERVALPDDLLDSLREFIGRVRHRRTVYERWGFDEVMASSRGLTALFYGPPGTGKTMVAGLIARELGLDLYRVDLSRVVSKWIGETEKNLAEVFDAAEDGQVVVVFDEADSLFARRTEVKSSVDRYANLEVNYLLQRLDSFEGIAILTTNLEGSIDPAFKRRMSLRLQFPFPDEDMRVRLWASHVPANVPIAGDLDLVELAHRFPLSGGYIRNSALRAAFLAAQEDVALSHDHLVRAIQLEYRELGKLSTSGRME